jgi:hypothetical protein
MKVAWRKGYLHTRGLKVVMDGVKGQQWTRVTSPLLGHKNICKSQRTVMTLGLHSEMLGKRGHYGHCYDHV